MPSKQTQTRQNRQEIVLDAIRLGDDLRTACGRAGVDRGTHDKWIERYPDTYAKQYHTAVERRRGRPALDPNRAKNLNYARVETDVVDFLIALAKGDDGVSTKIFHRYLSAGTVDAFVFALAYPLVAMTRASVDRIGIDLEMEEALRNWIGGYFLQAAS